MNRCLLISMLSLVLFAQACRSTRETTATNEAVPNRKPIELTDSLNAHDQRCDWISIKYEVEIKTDKIDDSFKLYVRSKRDSALWISATYYAVEVARFLFTPDSVKFMDRKNNEYFIGGYDYISDRFLVEADFETLQALISANGGHFMNNQKEKLHSSKVQNGYKLSHLTDGQLRRAIKREEGKNSTDLAISLVLSPRSFRVLSTSILDITDDRSLVANYSDFEPLCNSSHPHTIVFEAKSPNEQATVKTSILKISSGKRVSLSFTIPEKYESLAP